MLKKAILISYYDGYEMRLQLAKEILEPQYDVKIIASDFDHILKRRVEKKASINFYIHVPEYKKNISLRRIWSYCYFGKKINKYIKKTHPDLIYLLLPPNNTAHYCMRYKRKNKHIRYIVDIIDMWPESMPMPAVKKSLPGRMWAKMRDESLTEADIVFTECDLYQKELKKKLVDKDKVETIYLFKNQTQRETDLVSQTLKYYGDYSEKHPNKLCLGYLGSINYIIDIDGITTIVTALKQIYNEIEFRIIGDGENRDRFISGLEKTGAKVVFYGKVYDEHEKINILGSCDFAFNMMIDQVTVGLTIKSVDYFSMALPIINNIKGDTWSLVECEKIGFNYDGDIEGFVSGFHKFKTDERQRVRNCYNNYFTRDSMLKKMKHIIG